MILTKERYTTNEKIQADQVLKEEERTGEDKKAIISNDAYAMAEIMEQSILLMSTNLQKAFRSLAK